MDTANASGKALVRILSDILDYSRMETGKKELVPEPFDYEETVLSCVTLFREEAESKGSRCPS